MSTHADKGRREKLERALEKTVPSVEFSPEGTQQELARTPTAETPSPTPQQYLLKTKTDPSGMSDTDGRPSMDGFGTTSIVPPELLDGDEPEGPRFEVQGEAGRGGTAYVYKVVDRSLGRTIALKLLRGKGRRREGLKRRFIHEARVTAMLEHPNIVPVYDIGVTDDHRVYFLMKNVTGVSVGDAIRAACEDKPVPPEFGAIDGRLRIVLKVCDALAFAHDKGYVHQDIKPDNIMLGSFGDVLVLDWGCALGVGERNQGKAATFGTPAYMSPEQARQEGADERSDVFCLGATLYHMLTLHHPTWSDDPNAFWDMKRRGALSELPPRVRESIPEPLLALVRTAMAPAPADRFQSATALQNAIVEYLNHVESIALAHRASEQLQAAGDRADYHEYARITARFEQSLEMWDQNTDARDGLIRVRRCHAMRALDRGDLALAESIAGLDDALSDIRDLTGREKTRRQRRQRRIRRTLYAAAALAIVLIAFSGYYVVDYFRYFGKWQELYHVDFTREDVDLSGVVFSSTDLTAEDDPQPLGDGGLELADGRMFWARDVRERGDVRVEVCVTWPEGVDGLELMLNARREQYGSFARCPTGYSCQFGGWRGTVNIISRNTRPSWPDQGNSVGCDLGAGRSYRLWFQRVGEELSLFVDGRLVFRVVEPLPLPGDDLVWVGVRSWTDVLIESFTVWRMGAPQKASPLIAGDALVRRGHMRQGAMEYLRIAEDHAGTAIEEQALIRAYLAGSQTAAADTLCRHIRETMTAAHPRSTYWPLLMQADCLAAWRSGRYEQALKQGAQVLDRDPDSRVALRMLSSRSDSIPSGILEGALRLVARTTAVYGLSVENSLLSDISALAGLPLRSLAIRRNTIGDISALRGMPLRLLLLASNPVSDLSPLRGTELTVLDAEACMISDLRPLTGMALTSLNLAENRISDVEPLRGMPLQSLEIAMNELRSCAPLEGMHTLRELELSHNPIADLNPLRGTPLRFLQISETRVTSLDALRGMPLVELNVSHTAITDLRPLAGMPLTRVRIHGCAVASLEPLAGMPLVTLEAGGCNIADLAPLAGMPLRTLDCAGNEIADISALAGMGLSQVDISENRIADLSPLAGMPLRVLLAYGNPLASLQPFEDNPPEQFVFDSVAGSDEYVKSVLKTWERTGNTLSALLSRTAIAFRRGDAALLKRLATPLRGHRYLYVPGMRTYEQALAAAQRVGGYVVTSAHPEEHDLLLKLLPVGHIAWLGIDTAAASARWQTGEPLTFDYFRTHHRARPMPKYLQRYSHSGVNWFAAGRRDFEAELIIEWDN